MWHSLIIGPVDLISSADRFTKKQAAAVRANILAAYPNVPALGCPFDGLNTTYDQPSQYKRMAAIFTDTTYTEAWEEYLTWFSKTQPTWGLQWETPIPGPGIDFAYGVTHASDLAYYFPDLLEEANDPRRSGQAHLVDQLQCALVNFVTDLDPNGDRTSSETDTYHWPSFGEGGKVTSFTVELGAHEVLPPNRRGLEVIRKWFRPYDF